ncbi:unnamed protein product [Citrullus colocynthis]|uniref:Uncharacterized protein n=1 Tax=Citrullus colocynthis TaxID=252529 RepID=A0ABP0Y9T0_9ROSI
MVYISGLQEAVAATAFCSTFLSFTRFHWLNGLAACWEFFTFLADVDVERLLLPQKSKGKSPGNHLVRLLLSLKKPSLESTNSAVMDKTSVEWKMGRYREGARKNESGSD